MSYPLPKEARALQAAVRRYVDEELIPWEVHAEMNHGEVPPEILARQKKAARDLGLSSMDAPRKLGGGGMSMLLQAVAQEQTGRVTNALGWRFSNVQRWMTEACSPLPDRDLGEAAHRGHAPRMLRHHRGTMPAPTSTPSRRPRGATASDYVLNGEKWHVTSAPTWPTIIIFQGKLADGPNAGSALPVLRRHATRRASRWCARPPIRTPSPRITRSIASRTCACPPPTASARKATAWASPTTGSAMSG